MLQLPISERENQWPAHLRLALVDDDPAMHAELRDTIAAHTHGAGWTVESYYDALDALRRIPDSKPNVALVKRCLAGNTGLDCVRRLKVLAPALPIIVFTAKQDEDGVLRSLTAGACGYLVKPIRPPVLLSAIADAARGYLALCEHGKRVFPRWLALLGSSQLFEELTPREREILPFILQGLNDDQISNRLPIRIDATTVHCHRKNLYKKLGVHSQEELIEKFLRLRPGRRH